MRVVAIPPLDRQIAVVSRMAASKLTVGAAQVDEGYSIQAEAGWAVQVAWALEVLAVQAAALPAQNVLAAAA